jgi:hypothetical protein
MVYWCSGINIWLNTLFYSDALFNIGMINLLLIVSDLYLFCRYSLFYRKLVLGVQLMWAGYVNVILIIVFCVSPLVSIQVLGETLTRIASLSVRVCLYTIHCHRL